MHVKAPENNKLPDSMLLKETVARSTSLRCCAERRPQTKEATGSVFARPLDAARFRKAKLVDAQTG